MRKKMLMHRAVCFWLAVTLIGGTTAMAAESSPVPVKSVTSSNSIGPRAEQCEWIFRDNNGTIQRRLWSYTRGIWLTEWQDCV